MPPFRTRLNSEFDDVAVPLHRRRAHAAVVILVVGLALGAALDLAIRQGRDSPNIGAAPDQGSASNGPMAQGSPLPTPVAVSTGTPVIGPDDSMAETNIGSPTPTPSAQVATTTTSGGGGSGRQPGSNPATTAPTTIPQAPAPTAAPTAPPAPTSPPPTEPPLLCTTPLPDPLPSATACVEL